MALAAATVAGFWQIALTGRILSGYDLLTYFYPYREVVNQALRAGRIPFWNPDIFLGVPLLANIQTAVFYPPNWLTIGLEAPQAITALTLFHVLLAGIGMYYFCRLTVRLDRLGALVGGLVFMLSGFFSGQTGHPNQLAASAWIPIIFVLYEQACRYKSYPLLLLASGSLAVQFLAGHTQESYLTLVALGFFFCWQLLIGTRRALWLGLPSPKGWKAHLALTGRMLVRWATELSFTSIAFGAMLVIGVGLAALQLLPTLELSGESIRAGGLSFKEVTSFSLRPWEALLALLPGYLENPFSEYIAYIGILPLGLGLVALGVKLRNPYTVFMLALAGLALFMALGNFNPFYELVYRYWPGLKLFRVPARWLFLYTFAASTLAAIGASAFSQAPKCGRASLASLRRSQLGITLVVVGVFSLVWLINPLLTFPRKEVLAIWVPMIALTLLLILGGLPWAPNRWLATCIVLIVAVELWAARGDLDISHPVSPQAYTSLRPTVSQLLIDPGRFRILSVSEGTFDPGDFPDLRVILKDELTPERIQDYVTVAKYNEFLTPNMPMRYGLSTIDGYDGGVLPLRRYVDFKNVLLESAEANTGGVALRPNNRQPDGILREQLDALPDATLLGMLNVRYAIMDKSRDAWYSNAYYDLAMSQRIRPHESFTLKNLPPFAATSLGLITYLQEAQNVPAGRVVATVEITDSTGEVYTDTLKAGYDTAEGEYNQGVPIAHPLPQKTVASLWKGNPQAYNYWAAVKFDKPKYAKEIKITSTLDTADLVVRGASLVDDRTQASESLVLNSNWKLVASGDLKVYQNMAWRDRAYLSRDVRVVNNEGEALNIVRSTAGRTTALSGPDAKQIIAGPASSRDNLEIQTFAPEHRVMTTTLDSPAYVVLSETMYPGWQAAIDGKPVPISRANGLFMAVLVPTGTHTVEFTFAPASFALGLWITQTVATAITIGLVVWVLVTVALPWILRRRSRRAAPKAT